MINVTSQILKFRNFLLDSWHDLDLLMSNHNWDDDGGFISEWLQVNWEFLVERELLEKNRFLTPYAFINKRITHPSARATNEIVIFSESNNAMIDASTRKVISSPLKLHFGGFVSKVDSGYGIYPPFDYVTALEQNKKQIYELHIKDVRFALCDIDKN